MADPPEVPPRLGSVTFRGVSSRLPPRPPPVVVDTGSTSAPSRAPRPADTPAASRQPRRLQAREHRPEPGAPLGDAGRVGTGQLHARIPPYIAAWIRDSGQTQRAVLLAAFAEHGEEIPASRDPVILSRQRLGLPTRPVPKRRGLTEAVNFSLTGEEKTLVQARAAELQLSITDLVTELLLVAYNTASVGVEP